MSEIKLTILGEGFSFEKVITQQRAGQIISLLGQEQSTLLPPLSGEPMKQFVAERRGFAGRGVRAEIRELPISTALEGYPGYYELPTKTDKIIWLLEYAEQNGVKGLNSGEIDFLSSELKDRIEAKNFGAFNARNMRNAFVKKIGGMFHSQKKGLDYLRGLQK